MQKERQQLLLITSYNGVYQEDYKIPIHSLLHAVEVLPQHSYVTSSCKSPAIAKVVTQLCTTSSTDLNSYDYPEQAPMVARSSSTNNWGWAVTRRRCLNVPAQAPIRVAPEAHQNDRSYVRELSGLIFDSLRKNLAWWVVTRRT